MPVLDSYTLSLSHGMYAIQWINWTHMGIPIKHERGNVVVRQRLNIVNSWSGWLHERMQCVRKLQQIIWWASLFEWFGARDKPIINYFGISYFPNSNETHWTMNTSISCKLLGCSRSHSTFIHRHTLNVRTINIGLLRWFATAELFYCRGSRLEWVEATAIRIEWNWFVWFGRWRHLRNWTVYRRWT